MTQTQRLLLSFAIAAIAVGLIVIVRNVAGPKTTTNTTTNQSNTNTEVTNTNTSASSATLTDFSTSDLPDRNGAFSFSGKIPSNWAVEAVGASDAINIFDPEANAGSSLDQSKIFVKFFKASTFETLTNVDIKSQKDETFAGHTARTYVIVKKSGVADFPNQPKWRNGEHRVTDIRTTSSSPTTFYVFAKAPDVSDATFDAFLNSLKFGDEADIGSVVYPLHDFLSRITKKNFGQYITPQNSPVQPERFSGYHAAVDAEIFDNEKDSAVPVFSVGDGTIKLLRSVDGYGGVVMIEYTIDKETVTALYGHVTLTSVHKKVGDKVKKGEQIAVLGKGFSTETDGERKHLHFAVLKGASLKLAGYVDSKAALSPWENPLDWLRSHGAREVT